MSNDPLVLVKKSCLPDVMQKTLEVKRLLAMGLISTVQEGVDQVEMSRSSFYKYKDHIFPFDELVKEKMINLSLTLENQPGVLSQILGYLAENGVNVLTIHQTIPLQGEANVSISIEIGQMKMSLNQVIGGLRALPGLIRVTIIGTGS
ncbi:ACT domain-containing protein [Hazenella sp. IB182357]|uniref:UPF0735 ACT domain-containing protein IC620_05250 n=1 Tax=Polycladospora coralii TaxID=2771432 RepID=A0A926N5G8_9BACL|nr:ACT domain-containing protein [Polycladospora coralii]MBD1371764.1 ACT domain-containing protein [Polycladospora coralii]MBS7529225.1 ACT domain-containing protein [Polycladospora coralii]